MTRLQADLALLFAGLIWGFGFVAQKTALDHVGCFTFVAARFLVSALVVLPFVFREKGFQRIGVSFKTRSAALKLGILCGVFSVGVILQQYGLGTTTVTKTAFLTGTYIIMVPFVGYLFYKQKLSSLILAASVLSVFGIWLLSGGNPGDLTLDFNRGDILVLLCAFCFAMQVTVLGHLAKNMRAPFTISLLQYIAVGLAALVLAMCFEPIEWRALLDAWFPILFAGIASGGIAYTLQAVAQQHTPSADAAIMMSSETLFGGIGGMWLLKEKLTIEGFAGCAMILAAVILVELGPLWHKAKKLRRRPAKAAP